MFYSGLTPSAELRLGYGVWFDDLERARSLDEYGVTHSCCPIVRDMFQGYDYALIIEPLVEDRWSLRSTVAIYSFLQILRTSGTKLEISRYIKSQEAPYPSCTA
jgi:hypothetical protein